MNNNETTTSFRNSATGEVVSNVTPEYIKNLNTAIMLEHGSRAWDVGLWLVNNKNSKRG